MDELLTEFLAEATENLAALDEALLKLERTPADSSTIAVAFRLVHTIKGTCGFLPLPRLEKVAHAAEDLLGALRDGARQATPPLITLILAAVDRIKQIVADTAAMGAGLASSRPTKRQARSHKASASTSRRSKR